MFRPRFILLVALALSASASAQITAIGPFTGAQSDGFESQLNGQYTCVAGRVFNNTADACTPHTQALYITSGWSFICQINPNSGNQLMGSGDIAVQYTFDTPAQRFGGMFGNNYNVDDGLAIFFDAAGNQIGTRTITAPANCSWTWNGWDAGAGPLFKTVEIWGPVLPQGGFMMMDDMEVDYGTGGPATYSCTPGDPGINLCPCSNPPAGADRGCNNKDGTGGASITGTGSNSLATPTLAFTTANENATVGSVLLQGSTFNAGVNFGHGIRCAAGVLKRLYVKIAVGGSITAPGVGDPNIPTRSAALGAPLIPGDIRYYQVYYRDTTILLPGCALPANQFNVTNAAQVTWQP